MRTSYASKRAIGQYPLSIATSLPLEHICGIHPDYIVKTLPILEYEELWINLRTLFRNFIGALEKDDVGRISPPMIASALFEEMSYIEDIVKEKSAGTVRVVFYYSDYSGIEQHHKGAVLRMDNTEKQKEYTRLHNQTIDLVLKQHKVNPSNNLFLYQLHLKPKSVEKKKALIITHYAIDLISYKEFSHLTLLESHTGKLKERAQWYTKYADGKVLSQIPFTLYFLIIFGDDATFRPFQIKTRNNILEISRKYHWNSITTRDKILYGIKELKNPYEKTILLDIIHSCPI